MSESTQQGPGARPEPPNGRTGTFKLARDEELRLLELQRTQIDNVRTRTSQYLAFIGSASAFLAGSGIRAEDRDAWFVAAAAVAVACSLGSVGLAYAILGNFDPMKMFKKHRQLTWAWGPEEGAHALDYARSTVPPVSEWELSEVLADRYQRARKSNSSNLVTVQSSYKWFLTLGALQLLAWTLVVVTRGG